MRNWWKDWEWSFGVGWKVNDKFRFRSLLHYSVAYRSRYSLMNGPATHSNPNMNCAFTENGQSPLTDMVSVISKSKFKLKANGKIKFENKNRQQYLTDHRIYIFWRIVNRYETDRWLHTIKAFVVKISSTRFT